MANLKGEKSNMKKLLALFIVATMMLSFVACATPETTEPATTDSSSETSSDEQITLQFLANETPILPREFWQTVADRYNAENPNVTIEMLYQPASNISVNEHAKTLLATGQFPDVMVMTTPSDYVPSGALLELDDADVDMINPDYISRIDGSIYFVPYKIQVGGVWYNKDMFAERGLEVPTTWDEFVVILDTFADEGITPNVMGLKDGWAHVVPFGCIGATEVLQNNPDFPAQRMAGETTFAENAEFVDTLNKFSLLMNDYNVSDKSSMTFVQSNDKFFGGEIPMYIMGSWAQGEDMNRDMQFEVGYFPIPTDDGEMIIPSWVNEGLSISSQTEHPEVAKDFIRFFLEDEEWSGEFLKSEQLFSPLANGGVEYEATDLHNEVVATVAEGRAIPNLFDQVGDNAWIAGGGDLISKATLDIASGGDVTEALENLDNEFDMLLENFAE